MRCFYWLIAATAASSLDATAASQGRLSAIKQTNTETIAVLLNMLKELQLETESGKHVAGSMSTWCKDASKQKTEMLASIARQLDESKVAVQQIASDEQQLQSEMDLEQSAYKEKDQRLNDAAATASLTMGDAQQEIQQVETAISAAKDAIHLVNIQMQQHGIASSSAGAESVGNLMQVSSDRMTDDEKQMMSSFVSDPDGGHGPKAMLQTLTNMQSRLTEERNSAMADSKAIHQKLWTFTDHLNSSIIEMKSQSAAIGMELAHRKRERTLMEGKMSELSVLSKVIEESKTAAEASCHKEADRTGLAAKLISEEVKAVRTILSQLPSSADSMLTNQDASSSFLQVRSTHVSSLQGALHDLQSLAQSFPGEAAWFVEGAQRLDASSGVVLAEVSQHHQVKRRTGSAPNPDADPLHDIADFASDMPNGGAARAASSLNNLEAPKKIKGLYKSLSDRLTDKEKAVGNLERWCSSVVRDAQADDDAIARASKRTDAKLDLAKVATLEAERDAGYYQKQHDDLAAQLASIHATAQEEGAEFTRSRDVIKDFSKELISLSSQLSDDITDDEKKSADMARAFVEELEHHEEKMQEWHEGFQRMQEEIESADKLMQRTLADNVKRNQRRLVKFKAEAQLLNSLSNAKQFDKTMSDRYRQVSMSVCSKDRIQAMDKKEQELQQEVAALQTSLAKRTKSA